ncbi:hypothetical protein [Rhizobium sp. 10PS4]|uniref:hypothetical protein n=1 Tax=Rhizobium sp. 10PS4 TaxID=3075621 RepID=UPI0028FDA8C4|nr:hypothetical protein [Rhizobium sp. 10PS4]MDU0309429.1 hypothetical protein [Rhizobium sp. 10PS4]
MTKRQGVKREDAKLLEFDQLQSNRFLELTRRQIIATAAAGVAFLANLDDLAQAAAENAGGNTGGASEDRSTSERQQQTVNRTDSTSQAEQSEEVFKFNDIKSLLGSEFRGRSSSIQTLTKHQRDATGTSEEPDRREVDAGNYFSNGFNRKLTSSSESPLGSALRTRSGSRNSTTRLSSEEKAILSAFVAAGATAQTQKPNEGRAEVFFGGAGAATGRVVGAVLVGAAGWQLAPASGATVAGLSAGLLSTAVGMFETPGREAGEAFGRWVDPKIEHFKEDTRYDSRADPRYNPFGWPYN